MFWIRFIFPFVSAAVVFTSFDISANHTAVVGWWFLVSFLSVILAEWLIVLPATFRDRILFVSTIGGFLLSGWMILFFLPHIWFVHVLAIVSAFLVFLFLFASFYFFHVPHRYQPFALDNAGTYIGILTVFLFSSALSGIMIFLPQPLWIIIVLMFLLNACVAYMIFWANKVLSNGGLKYVLMTSLLSVEFFWAVSLLPVSLFLRGAIVAAMFYFLTGVVRAHILGRLNRQAIIRYSLIAGVVFLTMVASGRWS